MILRLFDSLCLLLCLFLAWQQQRTQPIKSEEDKQNLISSSSQAEVKSAAFAAAEAALL